jgi:hypothetical protein
MALVVQANLLQLKILDARRRGVPPETHEPRVNSPGAVLRFREALLDHRRLQTYSDVELALRLREYWGRICAMQWLFELRDDRAADYSRLRDGAELRCPTELDIKLAEIEAMLWRLQFEQRCRQDSFFRQSPDFA